MGKKAKVVVILIAILVATSGCAEEKRRPLTASPVAGPTAIFTPSAEPTEAGQSLSPQALADRFLMDRVGDRYFNEHYTFVVAEMGGADLVKVTYRYTYEPYVQDYPFTALLNPQKQGLADKETSVILLEPQTFKISREKAIAVALENGLAPNKGTYEVNLTFGPITNNRFAWEVTSPGVSPTQEVPEPIFRVILDVESSEVYATEKIAPMKSQ